jgi:hypothetical protein
MRRRLRTALIIKRLATASVAAFVLCVACVLPFLIHDDAYGEVPIPGSGTVHLLPGDVDVTLLSARLADNADEMSVPQVSLQISAPDGTPQPEVIESRRAKCITAECDTRTRIWVVRVLREADYHVTMDGEVYGPFQPTAAFGHIIWNDVLLALLALGSALRWLVFGGAAVVVVLGLAALVIPAPGLSDAERTRNPSEAMSAEPSDPPRVEQLRHAGAAAEVHDRPLQELVLNYPEPRNRFGKYLSFVLAFLVLVGGPVVGIYSWFHLPGPVCWTPVVVLGLIGAGSSWILGRLVIRWAVIARRRARGDGWLRLSSTGFEIYPRWGKPRRYEWREIDRFMLVESRDDEGGVVQHVGFRFSTKRAPTRTDKIWQAKPPRRHRIDGYWDGPLDEAVDLMNEWLTFSRPTRDLESR